MKGRLCQAIEPLAALQALSVAQDLDAIEVDFADDLARFAQLEFRDDGRRIDLIFGTREPGVVDRWAARLESRGVTAAALATPLAVARLAGGRGIGLKLPVAGPVDSGELYVRGAMPIAEVCAFLRAHGCSAAVETLAAVGSALGRDHAYMLAADVAIEPRFSIIFTQYIADGGEGVVDRLHTAAGVLGVDDCSVWGERHRRLEIGRPRTLFCSVACGLAGVERALKLDYSDVELSALADAVETEFDVAVLHQWRSVLGRRVVDQVGFVYCADRRRGLRAYFGYRHR